MKKLILGLLIIGSGAWAEFEVKMNTKALYRETFEKLTVEQQNYILDNMDSIQSTTEAILKKETTPLKKEKNIEDKNVVEIILTKDGAIEEIKFLMRSSERRYDDITKKVLEEAVKSFPKPKEKTPIRMIIIYENGNSRPFVSEKEKAEKEKYANMLQRGTTRFEHSMSQQVREFETSKDGFINVSLRPQMCASLQILTENNQQVRNGTYTYWTINTEVPKGRYKILVQTKETCDLNIQYP